MRTMDLAGLTRAGKEPAPPGTPTVAVALLADCATQQLAQALTGALRERGLAAAVSEAPFDSIEQSVLAEGGALGGRPDVTVIYRSLWRLEEVFDATAPAERASLAETLIEKERQLWRGVVERTRGAVIANDHPVPMRREFGNLGPVVPASFAAFVEELNERLIGAIRQERAVLLNDVRYLAARVGADAWSSRKWWIRARYPVEPSMLPRLAHNLAGIVAARQGRIVKCVAVDLDGVLWGGIVGDDGVEGILLGPEGLGEAYLGLQRYLRELARRGILLAVCSKNDEATARTALATHPAMLLRGEDFVAFVANWDDKASNLREIARRLNIGPDSILFLDDSRFERELVRALVPEVLVPELPDDPAGYVEALDDGAYFETTTFTAEDAIRGEYHRQDAKRETERARHATLDDYLRNLEMVAQVGPIRSAQLPRLAQLAVRTNQFNLTTRRYSEEDLTRVAEDSDRYDSVVVSLRDRFGNAGTIALAILRHERDGSEIEAWLMSCRVLSRGLERVVLDELAQMARAKGRERLIGLYIPTAKNGLVARLYEQLGFVAAARAGAGERWELSLAGHERSPGFIRIER